MTSQILREFQELALKPALSPLPPSPPRRTGTRISFSSTSSEDDSDSDTAVSDLEDAADLFDFDFDFTSEERTEDRVDLERTKGLEIENEKESEDSPSVQEMHEDLSEQVEMFHEADTTVHSGAEPLCANTGEVSQSEGGFGLHDSDKSTEGKESRLEHAENNGRDVSVEGATCRTESAQFSKEIPCMKQKQSSVDSKSDEKATSRLLDTSSETNNNAKTESGKEIFHEEPICERKEEPSSVSCEGEGTRVLSLKVSPEKSVTRSRAKKMSETALDSTRDETAKKTAAKTVSSSPLKHENEEMREKPEGMELSHNSKLSTSLSTQATETSSYSGKPPKDDDDLGEEFSLSDFQVSLLPVLSPLPDSPPFPPPVQRFSPSPSLRAILADVDMFADDLPPLSPVPSAPANCDFQSGNPDAPKGRTQRTSCKRQRKRPAEETKGLSPVNKKQRINKVESISGENVDLFIFDAEDTMKKKKKNRRNKVDSWGLSFLGEEENFALTWIKRLHQNNVKLDVVMARLSDVKCVSSSAPLASAIVGLLGESQVDLLAGVLEQYYAQPQSAVSAVQWKAVLSGFEARLVYVILGVSEYPASRDLVSQLIGLISKTLVLSCASRTDGESLGLASQW